MTKYQLISITNNEIEFMEFYNTPNEAFIVLKEWLKEYGVKLEWESGDITRGFLYNDDSKMKDYAIPFCTPKQIKIYDCGIKLQALLDDLKIDKWCDEDRYYIVVLD
jgi:hypothetical protein